MSLKELKITKKDVGTMIVVAIALALVGVVVITLLTNRTTQLDNEADNTAVFVYSTVNEQGEIEFYTMIEEYTDSGFHASVWYPAKTTTEPSTEESSVSEPTTAVEVVTDAEGQPVTDAEGNVVTEILTEPLPPETSVQAVTDEAGVAVTDAKGKPVTQVVTVTESTTKDIWEEESTTKKFKIKTPYTVETGTANTIISEVNRQRTEAGLPALTTSKNLTTKAKTSAMAKALPDYGVAGGAYYSAVTATGGAAIYNGLIGATDITATEEYTNIGVAVIKYNGQYYTAVLLS